MKLITITVSKFAWHHLIWVKNIKCLSRQSLQKSLCLAAFILAMLVSVQPLQAQSFNETIANVQSRMVKIHGAGGLQNLHAYSTGFLVSAEGHIVTIWNHVLDTDEVTVVLGDGRRFEAAILEAEPQDDLAILKIRSENLNLDHFELDSARDAQAGTRILSFSNMFKVAAGDEPLSVMHGVISAKAKLSARRGVYDVSFEGPVYIIDAISNNPGAGGGVVTTRDGHVLGMIGRELRNAESNTWVNYAIPLASIRDTIKEIISGNYKTKEKNPDDNVKLANYRPLDFGLVMVPDVLYRTPAFVDSVVPGSVAAEAKPKLQPDDLILFINDVLIHSCRDLKQELGKLEAGDTLTLIVRRKDEIINVTLLVKQKPDKTLE